MLKGLLYFSFVASITISSSLFAQTETAQTPAISETASNPVRILLLPDTGLIVITGSPEDVLWLEKQAIKFMAASEPSRPEARVVPLNWVEPRKTAELIQAVYDQQYESRLGKATISPIPQPRGLLVTGGASAHKIIKELAEKFDE